MNKQCKSTEGFLQNLQVLFTEKKQESMGVPKKKPFTTDL